jgi:hypothetical protein
MEDNEVNDEAVEAYLREKERVEKEAEEELGRKKEFLKTSIAEVFDSEGNELEQFANFFLSFLVEKKGIQNAVHDLNLVTFQELTEIIYEFKRKYVSHSLQIFEPSELHLENSDIRSQIEREFKAQKVYYVLLRLPRATAAGTTSSRATRSAKRSTTTSPSARESPPGPSSAGTVPPTQKLHQEKRRVLRDLGQAGTVGGSLHQLHEGKGGAEDPGLHLPAGHAVVGAARDVRSAAERQREGPREGQRGEREELHVEGVQFVH